MTAVPLQPVPWTGDERLTAAAIPGGRFLTEVRRFRPRADDALRTGAVETAVIVLGGTLDLAAGTTAWPARGIRSSAFAGRPVALFLPPHTELRTSGGGAELLLISARQPAQPAAAAGKAVLSHRPLLPLAGSGKAFDPASGEWRPAETFPTAAESLPPRRFARLEVGMCTVERLLAPDYKAAALSLDEVVVPSGAEFTVGDVPGRAPADELALFVRPAASALIRAGGALHIAAADTVCWLPVPRGTAPVAVAADGGPVYVALAYGGKG